MEATTPEAAVSERPAHTRSRFSLRDVNIACWTLFAILLAAPMSVSISNKIHSGMMLQEERDFILFYSVGRLLNEYPPSDLYNFDVQKKVMHSVFELKNGREYTPLPYPPFVDMFFRPFALLPFSTAYVLWLGISLCLYVAGLRLLTRHFFPDNVHWRSLIFCFAFSFFPFLWIMMGGQIPTVAFISLALAVWADNVERPILSGLALSLCLYKPTLLILMLPMLLVTRRYKILAGFAGGAAVLIGSATLIEGTSVWSGYLRMIFSFGSAAADGHGYRVLRYYMDLFAFSSMLPGGRSWPLAAILLTGASLAAATLLWIWAKGARLGGSVNSAIWAVTLTWTHLLNLYVPMYDSIVLLIAAIVSWAALRDCGTPRLKRGFLFSWVLLLAASWFTGEVLQRTGVQLFTVAAAVLGTVQMVHLIGRIIRSPMRITKGLGSEHQAILCHA